MAKIVRFHAENFQRLRAVEIEPGSAVVQIRGRNGQGKTSILDAIEAVLGGKGAVSDCPVRTGTHAARVVVETDDLIATREFDEDGASRLKVATKSGARIAAGQSVIDKLVSTLSFDPLAFTRQKPSAQRETLRALVGLDFTTLDKERAEAFALRTDVAREERRLEGELSGIAYYADAPEHEVSVTGAMAELDAARKAADSASALERQHGQLLVEGNRYREEARARREEAARLIAVAERAEAMAATSDEQAEKVRALAESAISAVPDQSPIRARIASADEVNARVRENAKRKEVESRLRAQSERVAALTSRIAEIDREKRAQLESASFPLPGMSISDAGITMNGLPFEQASGAEQLRAAVAIASALNPELRVLLVRDGSLLDDDSLRALSEAAESSGTQVWLERVSSDRDGAGVYIEDGQVWLSSKAAE